MSVAATLAALIADRRDPSHIRHTVADVLRARMLAIGCGYPDGNDFDWLRRDPAFKAGVRPPARQRPGNKERRVVARIEASASHADDMLRRGIDIRYIVTSLQGNEAEHIYQTISCARGQAENLIKQHKAQLSSDRTSCRSPLANQMRLILHTGAYWLLLDLRAAIPSWNPLRHTEFATIRLRLLKVAGRVIESATRIRIALASCCPETETFSLIALKLQPSGP